MRAGIAHARWGEEGPAGFAHAQKPEMKPRGGVRAEVRTGAAHAQWRGELFWGFYEY